jgi:hypothetical protein
MTGLETAGAIASLVTACVTTATLMVLIWYTVETHKLRLEAQRQNEHSMMPIVVFQSVYMRGQPTGQNRLVMRNLGAGPAFNVQFGPMRISGKPASFDHPRTLASRQDEFVAITGLREAMTSPIGQYDDGKIHDANDLLNAFKSTSDILETPGVITYTSASGKQYRTMFTIDHKAGNTESLVVFNGVEAL